MGNRYFSDHARMLPLSENSGGGRISPAPGKQQADPAAHRPGEQPGQPVPVWPALAPVGDNRADSHRFPDDKEPEHVARGAARSEAGTETGTKDRNDDEERRARDESGVGGDTAFDEIARE